MIKAVISDFSRVLLFPADKGYTGSLNSLNNSLLAKDSGYDFWEYFTLNRELLKYYASLGVPIYIFTTETVQEHPAIKEKLDAACKEIFSAKQLGVHKTDPKAYTLLAKKLGLRPNEISYIDDRPANVAAARKAGLASIHYRSNRDIIDKIA